MSIKKNFAFNTILTVSGYLFPLMTYPYVSRVLGVDNIGICNFVDSIVNYFIMFSMLGINGLGVREIAKNKGDKVKLKEIYSSLFLLNTMTTAIAVILLIVVTLSIDKLFLHKELFYFGVAKLIFNLFLTEWFFRGIENFKYITLRSLIINFLYVISVFVFIHKKEDYNIYYLLMTSTVVVNSVLNLCYRRKFVRFSFKTINLSPYWRAYVNLGIYVLLTSLYTTFNTMYLGFVIGSKEVGYYTTATKFYLIFLSLFSAFTVVMLPRISALVADKDFDEVKKLIAKSYEVIVLFSLPIIVLASVFAPQIISILAGPGFEGAVSPMRVIMPLMLIIGIEQILVIQILLPLKRDREILLNSIIGAICGITLNLILVKTYKSTGSASVWLASEVVVLYLSQRVVHSVLGLKFPIKKLLSDLAYIMPMFVVCFGLQWFYSGYEYYLSFIIAILFSAAYYFCIQVLWLKNKIFISLLEKLPLVNAVFLNRNKQR